MLRSMFSGVSGLRTHQNRMDVIGNNIANVNTAGFKSARATFMDSIYQAVSNSTAGTTIYGGSNPSQLGYGSQLASVDVNFATGSYEPTGYATDCMIGGNGFFMVGPKLSDKDASGGIDFNDALDNSDTAQNQSANLLLTRVGKFTVDGDGYLVDANGNVVYGFVTAQGTGTITADGEAVAGDTPYNPDTTKLVPLRVPSQPDPQNPPAVDYGEAEVINLSGIAIDANGIISGTAEDGTIYKIGQIALANVPNPNALESQGNSYYKAVNNTGFVQGFTPGAGTTSTLVTNGLEMANVDLATEFSSMITIQRGFQACSKMITVSDEMLQELVNMKR